MTLFSPFVSHAGLLSETTSAMLLLLVASASAFARVSAGRPRMMSIEISGYFALKAACICGMFAGSMATAYHVTLPSFFAAASIALHAALSFDDAAVVGAAPVADVAALCELLPHAAMTIETRASDAAVTPSLERIPMFTDPPSCR